MAPRTRDVGSGGQDRRRPPYNHPSDRAAPTGPGCDNTGGNALPKKIARIISCPEYRQDQACLLPTD